MRKITNEACTCPGISSTLHFGRAASGGALAPEPPRATGVGPEFPLIYVYLWKNSTLFPRLDFSEPCFLLLFPAFLRSDKIATFFPEIGQGLFLHFLGLCDPINPFFARSDVSHEYFWDRTKLDKLCLIWDWGSRRRPISKKKGKTAKKEATIRIEPKNRGNQRKRRLKSYWLRSDPCGAQQTIYNVCGLASG